MSKNMSSTNRRYEAANKKFDEAYNKYNRDIEAATSDYQRIFNEYTGDASLKKATNYAQDQASQQSLRAGTQAGATANRSARTAGLNKAQAAMLAQQAASDATGNMYQSAYDSSRNAALNNNQSTVTAKQGEYSTRVSAAATPLNARGQQLTAAQQEGQNAYNRSWGNVGGVGSMVTGLLTSDERLKEARDVSSDANTEDYKCFKCNIGTKRTSLADIATDLSTSIASDERLKTFREVSKSLNTNPTASSYNLLKVTYKHSKGE